MRYTLEELVKYIHFPTFCECPTHDEDRLKDARPSELEELSKSLEKINELPDDFTGEIMGIQVENGVPITLKTRLDINGRSTSIYYDVKVANDEIDHLKDGDIINQLYETHYDDDGDPTEYASISKCVVTDASLAIESELNDGIDFIEESGCADEVCGYYEHI